MLLQLKKTGSLRDIRQNEMDKVENLITTVKDKINNHCSKLNTVSEVCPNISVETEIVKTLYVNEPVFVDMQRGLEAFYDDIFQV